MTEIKSKEVTVKGTDKEIFEFLMDLNNFELLLPKDKISDWKSTNDECSFKVQNAATIELIKDSHEEFSLITLKSGERSPFPYTLDITIQDNGDGTCNGYQLFKGDMNPFLKMVAERPLQSLFDYIADRLVKIRAES